MKRVRTKPIYAMLAGAVLGVIVMPIAFAGAASDPEATASASVKKQVKKLKQQVNQLRQQLDEVSKQAGPQGPAGPQGAEGPPGPATGPAGGDLTGQYPNPSIGPDTVGSAQILDAGVRATDLGIDSVGDDQLKTDSVGSSEIADFSIEDSDLSANSVSGDKLNNVHAVVGPGVTVNAGTPANAEVTCPLGNVVLGAGYAWTKDEANSIIASAPSETDPRSTWIVRGMVDAGSNTLFAWANCLDRDR